MTAQAIDNTPTVTLEEVRRHLGWPRLPEGPLRSAFDQQAAQFGITLDPRPDWAGRPCIPVGQAAELVQAVEARWAATTREWRRREQATHIAKAAEDAYLTARARAVLTHVAEQTGDMGAAESMAYYAGRGQVSDQQLATTLEAALGRWAAGYRTLQPMGDRPAGPHEPVHLDGLENREDLIAAARTGKPPERMLRKLRKAMLEARIERAGQP